MKPLLVIIDPQNFFRPPLKQGVLFDNRMDPNIDLLQALSSHYKLAFAYQSPSDNFFMLCHAYKGFLQPASISSVQVSAFDFLPEPELIISDCGIKKYCHKAGPTFTLTEMSGPTIELPKRFAPSIIIYSNAKELREQIRTLALTAHTQTLGLTAPGFIPVSQLQLHVHVVSTGQGILEKIKAVHNDVFTPIKFFCNETSNLLDTIPSDRGYFGSPQPLGGGAGASPPSSGHSTPSDGGFYGSPQTLGAGASPLPSGGSTPSDGGYGDSPAIVRGSAGCGSPVPYGSPTMAKGAGASSPSSGGSTPSSDGCYDYSPAIPRESAGRGSPVQFVQQPQAKGLITPIATPPASPERPPKIPVADLPGNTAPPLPPAIIAPSQRRAPGPSTACTLL